MGKGLAVAEQATAVCTFSFDNGSLSPGLSSASAPGYWHAGPGPIDCTGSVNGRQVTGTGVIVESGSLEGSCARGSGSGTQSITLPTSGGDVHFTQPIMFRWAGAGGPFEGPRLSGMFEFRPTKGDCVTEPLTGYAQVTQGALRNP
jgi:hypothetical protein